MTYEQALSNFQADYLEIIFGESAPLTAPNKAAELVAAGASTPALDYLAGLSNFAEPGEISGLILRAGAELNFPTLETQQDYLRVAVLCTRLIGEEVLDPFRGCRFIANSLTWSLPEENQFTFLIFNGLDAEWSNRDHFQLRADIIEAAHDILNEEAPDYLRKIPSLSAPAAANSVMISRKSFVSRFRKRQ
jgi:hypothetical protein